MLAGGLNSAGWDGSHPDGTVILGRCQMIHELLFDKNFFLVPDTETEAGDEGLFGIDENAMYYKTQTKWVKSPFINFDDTFDPVPVRNTSNLNPGNYTTYEILPDNCTSLLHDATGATDMSRYRLPANPKDGMLIHIMKGYSTGTISLHTGATQDDNGVYRMMHPNTLGKSGNYAVSYTHLTLPTSDLV